MTEQNIPHPAFQKLLAACKKLPPIVTAIVHPCDTATLLAIADAEKRALITPVLVGPKAKILKAAAEAGVDISAYPLVDTPHSHASAGSAIDLVRQGKAAALMKGSLHTDELLEPALDRIQGIRTERRISHCFVMAMPGRAEPFIVSDAAVNIAPTLAEKADIVQNAIDLATALHWTDLRVAILSATEMINPAIQSTLDAAALCKMADRGQITGALIDGPLAFDNAIDQAAVSQKQINSPVAGRANILIVPDLESGNILAKSLSFMAHAEAAGIAMGARVPIILTSRADTVASRVISCALAVLVSQIPILKGIAKG